MDIPRDVLLAGIKVFVDREWAYLGKAITPEMREDAISALLDPENALVTAIVAAIEAWERRPYPWGELPAESREEVDA